MTRVELKTAIGPPIEVVSDFITEPLNDPAWLSSVLDIHARKGPIVVGSESVETMRFLGRWVEVTWRVTEHERPVRSADGARAESS